MKLTIKECEVFRKYLCEKYDRKCYTSPMGKCPLANDECWNFLSIKMMYISRNGPAKRELTQHIVEAMKKENYIKENTKEG